jgi:hypothetical protein
LKERRDDEMVSAIQRSQLRLFTISLRFPTGVSHIQQQDTPYFREGQLRLTAPSLLTEHGHGENNNRGKTRRFQSSFPAIS